MKTVYKRWLAMAMLVLLSACVVAPAERAGPAHVDVGIGIHVPVYPRLVLIPGYPVYYAPSLEMNFFFYDGVYWVFQGNGWYLSYWYNGPWRAVEPVLVPGVILNVPLRYYRRPPSHFHAWRPDEPPRWEEHWGHDWERQRGDDWRRHSKSGKLAPLPNFQREYSGQSYPRQIERQQELNRKNYHYSPQDPAVKRAYSHDKRGDGKGNKRY